VPATPGGLFDYVGRAANLWRTTAAGLSEHQMGNFWDLLALPIDPLRVTLKKDQRPDGPVTVLAEVYSDLLD
jgi:hypothetical protein